MNWCEQNQFIGVLYVTLQVLAIVGVLIIIRVKHQDYTQYKRTYDEQLSLLYQNRMDLLSPGWMPILVKVIAIYVLLASQFIGAIVQVMLYLFNDEMCGYFGAQYMADTLLWLIFLLIFTFEFKYIQKMTKNELYMYAIKVVCDTFAFFLLLSSLADPDNKNVPNRDLAYQFGFLTVGGTAAGLMLYITYKFPSLKPTRVEDNSVIDSFLSMQNSKLPEVSPKPQIQGPDLITADKDTRRQTAAFAPIPHHQQIYAESMDESRHQSAAGGVFVSVVEVKPHEPLIEAVMIESFTEVKKYGKKTLIYVIETKFRDKQEKVKTGRAFREFKQIYKTMVRQYPNLDHPSFPEKKDKNDYLTNKDLKERSKRFQEILRFWVQEKLQPESLINFLGDSDVESNKSSMSEGSNKSSQISHTSQVEPFNAEDQERFEIILKNQIDNSKIKGVLQSMKDLGSAQNLDCSIIEEAKESKEDDQFIIIQKEKDFIFKIKESQTTSSGIILYKIASYFDDRIVATGQRRYNEFKNLHRTLQPYLEPLDIQLPDQPIKEESIVDYRCKQLTIYLNKIYQVPDVRIDQAFKDFLGI